MPISKELREFLTDWMGKQEGRLCRNSRRWCRQQGFEDTFQLWDELGRLFEAQFEDRSYPFDRGTAGEANRRRIDWVVKALAE